MPPAIVTGVSPKEGPHGTKITIRGENFGNCPDDLIGVTICESDCTLTAEWKSSNKITARSGPCTGFGDIIVTTKNGGSGTCTIKFRGTTEVTIGPLKESPVWVEDHIFSSTSRRSLSPTVYHNEDPLCLYVESTEQSIPEEDLNEIFPNGSSNLGSDNFSPGRFLLQCHLTTSYEDLKAGLPHLRLKVSNQKEGRISFLKANIGEIFDQFDTLVEVKDKLEISVRDLSQSTQLLDTRINCTEKEVLELFQEVITRREQSDCKRNALNVLHRFRFLFCLPSKIDRYIKNGEFDLIVNDYEKVKRLFGDTDVPLFKKVLDEIDRKVVDARSCMLKTLETIPSSLDDYIKLIRNLANLESRDDPAWLAINYFLNSITQSMYDLKDKYIVLETSENAKKNRPGFRCLDTKPYRILFIEELIDLLEFKLPDFWKLGQCYFGGEFPVNIAPANYLKYKEITLSVIQTFSNLIRAAILPQTLQKSPLRNSFGTWSSVSYEITFAWLTHCLRYIRTCYACFIRLDLPSDALDIFAEIIFDLRLCIACNLWKQATADVLHLKEKETWMVDIHPEFGGITELPLLFGEMTDKVIKSVHETVLISELREYDLFTNSTATIKIISGVQTHFEAFVSVLEQLSENEERVSVISQLNATAGSYQNRTDQRMLIVMCNANLTLGVIVPKLFNLLTANKHPRTIDFDNCVNNKLALISSRIIDQYFEQRCDPLVGTIEPSMYFAHFEWDLPYKPTGIRPYVKEIILNLIGVRSEMHRIPMKSISQIMHRFVETIAEELARLMSCVKAFSKWGKIQAVADVSAVREATKSYSCAKTETFFNEAFDNIPKLTTEETAIVTTICKEFKVIMGLQLLSLKM